jgi:hypothetical protein
VENSDVCGEPDGLPLVVRVATISSGPPPVSSTGLSRSPDFADITCSCYLEDQPELTTWYSLGFYFDEGLPVLREQFWGSRRSLEEVLALAELCGVPRSSWTPAREEMPADGSLPMALQPSDGRRLRAAPSYGLAAWPRDRAADRRRTPSEVFEELLDEGYDGDHEPVRPMAVFLGQVLQAHPFVPGAARDDTVWYENPMWSVRPRLALFELQFAAVPTMLPWLTAVAGRHAVHLYDPQADAQLT